MVKVAKRSCGALHPPEGGLLPFPELLHDPARPCTAEVVAASELSLSLKGSASWLQSSSTVPVRVS